MFPVMDSFLKFVSFYFVIDRSLVDTVYSLRDQVRHIAIEYKKLRRDLEAEIRARNKLEVVIVNKLFVK